MTTTLLIISAFFAGVLAAAPMGPVNMVAIRRGLIIRWTRTLSVGMGCVMLEIIYIALGFWGGTQVMNRLGNESLQRWIGLPAAAIILCIGILILRKAVQNPQRVLAAARLERMQQRRTSLSRDVLTGAVLTAINPAVLLYWLGAASKLSEKAHLPAGSAAVWYAVGAATCGLACWFTFISLLVRLRPQKVGPNFFRAVNGLCGVVLTALGIIIGVQALR